MPRHTQSSTSVAPLALKWLGEDRHGSQILTAARELIALEQTAKQALPPALAAVCKVARMERQQIVLAVPSAAYAAKLRQLAPRILQQLNTRGWNLNQIDVKVQAGLTKAQTKTAPRETIPLDAAALQAFETLYSELRPGLLADAVQRLLKHHRQEA